MSNDNIGVSDKIASTVRGLMDAGSADRDLNKAFETARSNAGSDPESAYLYGLLLYTGNGTERDRKGALEAFNTASEGGFGPATIVKDEIGRNSEAVQDALMDLRFRAECADDKACKEIFSLYDTGKNPDGSRADVRKDHAEAIRLYMPCADKGDKDAQNTIGFMYLMGKGVPKDHELALKLLKASAEAGCAKAAYRLGYMYDTGQGDSEQDLDEAVVWYRRGADLGDPEAQYQLAGILSMKDSKYYNVTKSNEYLTKAAEQGQIEAAHQLGLMYAYGSNGVRRNVDKAKKFLIKSCEGGYDQAMVDYANMCFEGQVLPQDLETAAKWFQAAAAHFNGIAQYALGCMYGNGYYYKQDNEEAAKWFEEAAEGGEPNAQYAIGCFYYEGRGVAKDLKKAVAWFQESADQGHPGAMSFMAMFLINGHGIEQDVKGGLEMLNKVAESGYPEAQYYLGRIYAEGEYVKQDLSIAKKLLTKAANQGDPDAADYLAKLKKSKK